MAKKTAKWTQFVPANNLVTVHTETGTTQLTGNERGDNRTGTHELETIEGTWVRLADLNRWMHIRDVAMIMRASLAATKDGAEFLATRNAAMAVR